VVGQNLGTLTFVGFADLQSEVLKNVPIILYASGSADENDNSLVKVGSDEGEEEPESVGEVGQDVTDLHRRVQERSEVEVGGSGGRTGV
jgi:hypothetical protein